MQRLLIGLLILFGVAAIVGAVSQVAPLSSRMDAIDRRSRATQDDVIARLERVEREVSRLGKVIAAREPSGAGMTPTPAPDAAGTAASPASGIGSPMPSAAPASSMPRASVSPRPSAESNLAATAFLRGSVLPKDAEIAERMIRGDPLPEIARAVGYSEEFVLAKGVEIEKLLAGSVDAPKEIREAIRSYVERERGRR